MSARKGRSRRIEQDGVWRVGREPDLLSASWSSKSSELGKPNTGNRFDSPTGEYGVRYFATTLDACYGETLARFRADKKLVKVMTGEEDGHIRPLRLRA
jgi:hypothetical protein